MVRGHNKARFLQVEHTNKAFRQAVAALACAKNIAFLHIKPNLPQRYGDDDTMGISST